MCMDSQSERANLKTVKTINLNSRKMLQGQHYG